MYRRVNKTASSLAFTFLVLSGCSGRQDTRDPSVEITRIPPADKGGPDTLDVIEGRVRGARPGQRIVLYARGRGLVGAAGGPPALHRDRRRRNVEIADPPRDRIRGPARRSRIQPPASTETLPEMGAGVIAAHRRPRRPVPEAVPQPAPVQRLRVAGPRRAQRPGRPQPLRPRQRLDRRGRRAAPPHRGAGARLDLRGGQPHAPPGLRHVSVRRARRLAPRAGGGLQRVHHDGGAAPRELSRDGHRDQPVGQPRGHQRPVRRPALLRPRERGALRGAAGPAHPRLRWEPGRVTLRTEPGRGTRHATGGRWRSRSSRPGSRRRETSASG